MKNKFHSIQISHEMPLEMLLGNEEQNLGCDYHYSLVHLFERGGGPRGIDYFLYAVDQLKAHRTVILDNSIFELGCAFDPDKFAFWVQQLAKFAGKRNVNKHLVYIIPDVLDNCDATVASAIYFLDKYKKLPGRKMAVAQGKTFEELRSCYCQLNSLTKLDRTGISFNCEAYNLPRATQLQSWMDSRIEFVTLLESTTILKSPLHLLGCSLPQEFEAYQGNKNIVSLDTSNPVVHGLRGIPYEYGGLKTKLSVKLADLFETRVDQNQLDMIEWNVRRFRELVNGYY